MTIRVNSHVMTPNGPGIVQGRLVENGETRIIVSHNPNEPGVAETVRERFLRGIWVLWNYGVDDLQEI